MDHKLIQMSRFLDACQDVEQRAADLYHLLADQSLPEMRLARLWRKTALEEENHARQVKMARLLVMDIAGINIESWRSISRMREEIGSLFKKYSASPPDQVEALSTAIEFEERMEKFHMNNAVTFKEKAGHDLFEAMMAEDRGHVDTLRQELEHQRAARPPLSIAG